MELRRWFGLLALLAFGCSTTSAPSQSAGDAGPPGQDAVANPEEVHPVSDAGSPGQDAANPEEVHPVSDAGPSDSPPAGDAGGYWYGSIVWEEDNFGDFFLAVAFGTPLLTGESDRPFCANGTAAGSCCYVPVGMTNVPVGMATSTPPIGHVGGAKAGAAADACSLSAPLDLNPEAGLLTFTNNGRPTGKATRDVDVGYRYQATDGRPLQWKPADQLGVSSTGGPCVPAFSGTLKVVAPLNASIPAVVKVAEGFSLDWTPDPNADIVKLTFGGLTDQGGGSVTCQVPDAAGHLTVSSAIIKMLGVLSPPTVITVRRTKTQEVVQGHLFLVSDYSSDVPTTLQ